MEYVNILGNPRFCNLGFRHRLRRKKSGFMEWGYGTHGVIQIGINVKW